MKFCMHAWSFSAPSDGAIIEYEISNRRFSNFLRTYCDFLNNVYR